MSNQLDSLNHFSGSAPEKLLKQQALIHLQHCSFASLTLENIAAACGVSPVAAQALYPSKNTLMRDLFKDYTAPLSFDAMAKMQIIGTDTRQTITAFVKTVAQTILDPRFSALPLAVMRDTLSDREFGRIYQDTLLTRTADCLRLVINGGIEKGEFRAVDADLTMRSILGPVIMHLYMHYAFDDFAQHAANHMDLLVENHLSVLFDGIVKTPSPATS